MKRIFWSFLSLIISLALVIPAAAPVFADSDNNVKPQPTSWAALMIKAPNMTDVSQPVTITVFSKHGHETVAGASVYALKTSDLVISADSTNYTTILAEYEALAEAKGTFIGTTGNDGTVTGKFSETGRFMLVATRDGFIPGFSRLTVTLAAKKGLNIKSPGSAEVNKPVTLSVTERYTQQPVAKAAVYGQKIETLSVPPVSVTPPAKPAQPQVVSSSTASTTPAQTTATAETSTPTTAAVKPAQPQAVSPATASTTNVQPVTATAGETSASTATAVAKPAVPQVVSASLRVNNATVIKADPANTTAAVQYAAEVVNTGTLLGYTDESGNLTYAFPDSAGYILTATKEDYAPGFAKISIILADQKKLGVKSPGSSEVGSSVNFFVIERSTGQGVAGAGLWALRISDISGTAEPVWQSLVTGSAVSDVVQKYTAWAREKGIFLGNSSDSGQVTFAFKETGRYLLMAVKDGYAPGFNQINITPVGQKQLSVKAPASSYTGQQVSIRVFESNTGQPVEKAEVYAFRSTVTVIPPTIQQAPTVKDGTATQVIIDASYANAISTVEAERLLNGKDKAIFIGQTGKSGEVQYAFPDPGPYALVAVKDGYVPGGTRITILTPSLKALEVNALFNIAAGQPGYIRVWEKYTNQPVPKAAVYVLKISDAADVKIVPAPASNEKAKDEANRAKEKGSFAGYTDDNGQVAYTFGSSGQYILAAFKDGYEPGFAYITITLPVSKKALYIKAPAEAYAGDAVPVIVYDVNGKGVDKAAIYAVRMELVEAAASILKALPSVDVSVKEKYGPILRERSAFIGFTDENGMLSTRFSSPGAFILLAIKDSYVPDFARINIKSAPVPVPIPVPLPQPEPQTTEPTQKIPATSNTNR